ncbi:MAG: DUF2889 domain-containing protein [Variovorax sp.]
MPLPPTVDREELHLRRIEMRGYRRTDGLYDIEARLTDTKTHALPRDEGMVEPGEALHDMWLRLVVDKDLLVHDALAVTDASPHRICPEATAGLARIKGLRIGSGWTRAIKERFAGSQGCTHLTELLGPLATTAFQTLTALRLARPDTLDDDGRPNKIDSCYAYGSERAVVLHKWPAFYDGPKP